MNASPSPDPLLFLKPASSIIFSGESIIYPKQSHCVHHEVEVGIVIGKKTSHVSNDKALGSVLGYLIALDITARDIQNEAKKQGWPWGIAKGFDTFAPISEVVNADLIKDPNNLSFRLWLNSKLRQQGNTSDLIWSVESLISYISSIMALEPGDLILTGTPEGVGELKVGDEIRAELSDMVNLQVTVKK